MVDLTSEDEDVWNSVGVKNKAKPSKKNIKRDALSAKNALPKKPEIAIVGDSMTKNLQGWKMSKVKNVRNYTFPGATIENMSHHVIPAIEKKPEEIILHVGTNNLKSDSAQSIAEKISQIATTIQEKSPDTKVTISGIITRKDDVSLKEKITEANNLLQTSSEQHSWTFLEHSNIDDRSLNKGGIHLNKKGIGILIKNLITHIRSFNN